MKLVTFRHGDRVSHGVWLESGILDVGAYAAALRAGACLSSMLSIIQAGSKAIAAINELIVQQPPLLARQDVRLLAPLSNPPRNIFCVGRNYMEHVKEFDRARGVNADAPSCPHFFTKAPQTINDPDGAIPYFTDVTQQLDYEVELAVIIGKRGRDINRETALEHVFGYTICNDVSARDLQRRHEQWFKGKSLDGSLPLGPWIVTADEIGDPTTLELSLTLNGELRQSSSTSAMIFDIPTIVEQLSAGMTLLPGDIIATGTPSGVGYAMEPLGMMQDGDVVACTIDRIGTLTNRVVEVRR